MGDGMLQPNVRGPAMMLRIYIGQDDRWEGKPLYEQIVARLKIADIAGATVYQGAMGYGAHQRLHPSGRFGLSRDLPIMITVVDSEARIREVMPMLEEMVAEGLVVLSDVEVIKYQHAGGK